MRLQTTRFHRDYPHRTNSIYPKLPLMSDDVRGSFYVLFIERWGCHPVRPYSLKFLLTGVSKISTEPAFTRSFLPFLASPFEVWSGNS